MAIVRTGNGAGCHHAPGCPHDIGPAAAGDDGIGAVGRLSALRVPGIETAGIAQGAGPIERRTETPAERAAREAREAVAELVAPPVTHPAYRLVRAPEAPPEETMTAPAASPLIPCGTCLHEPVCALKRELPADPATLAQPSILGPGLWLVPSSVTIRCDHHLAAIASSPSGPAGAIREPAPTTGRHPGKAGEALEKALRARDCLAALERHGGDRRAAAAELGIRGNAFAMIVKHAQRQAATS